MSTERERDDRGRYTAEEIAVEQRRARVVELKVGGYNFREIAKELGVGLGTAYRDFKAVMDRTIAEANSTVNEERRVSLERIDKAIKALMPLLDEPDRMLDAMDRLDKLEKRRAALLGLDAPAKTEHSGGLAVASVALDELEQLRKAAQANECSSPPTNGDSGPSS